MPLPPKCDGRCNGRYCADATCLRSGDYAVTLGDSTLGVCVGSKYMISDANGNREQARVIAVHGNTLVLRPPRKPLTGAQILAVAGTLYAIVGVIGGFFGSAQVIGVASAIMLAGNVLAYNAERKRK